MSRSTFLKAAAALGVVAGLATPVSAQIALPSVTEAMSALKTGAGSTTATITTKDPTSLAVTGVQVQQITSTDAYGGKVGTFTASSQEGDSQRFAVGTSTNFGINASASSTAEYAVTSKAALGLGGSAFNQTIGSSGSNMDARTSGSLAESYASSEVATKIGSSAQSSFEREFAAGSSSSRYNFSWWGQGTATSWSGLSETQKKEYENSYNQEAKSIKETATTTFNNNESIREAANGVISGSFNATSSTSTGSEQDNNQVTVKGIGNSANMRNDSRSYFDVGVQARKADVIPTSNSATANGSAGANMSSTASADASATSFKSIFIQSF